MSAGWRWVNSDGLVARARLANDWALKPVRIQGERRIELTGPSGAHLKELEQDGVIRERINYDTRFFIPVGEDGAKVLARITQSRPIVDVEGGSELSLISPWILRIGAGLRPAGEKPQSRLQQKTAANLSTGAGVASSWQSFTGPRGGRGWRSAQTGRVVYQAEMPGEHEHEGDSQDDQGGTGRRAAKRADRTVD